MLLFYNKWMNGGSRMSNIPLYELKNQSGKSSKSNSSSTRSSELKKDTKDVVKGAAGNILASLAVGVVGLLSVFAGGDGN